MQIEHVAQEQERQLSRTQQEVFPKERVLLSIQKKQDDGSYRNVLTISKRDSNSEESLEDRKRYGIVN